MSPKAQKLKIIIADDHPVFRCGLEAALASIPNIAKIAQAANGEEVIRLLQIEHYAIVFMDIKMSPMDGIKTTDIIKKRFPKTKVIALSMHEEQDKIMSILDKGANGYLIKNADKSEIEMAINEVVAGKSYFSQQVSKMLYDQINIQNNNGSKKGDVLANDRFRDIIFLLYFELTSEEIAEAMFLSVRTIEDYRSQILDITNSHSTIGILKFAIERNLQNDIALKKKYEKALSKKAQGQ